MDHTTFQLLYELPENINVEADTLVQELSLDEIPAEHLNKVRALLHSQDEGIAFNAAKLLTHWGDETGFEHLTQLFENNKLDGYTNHRLHGYDDTLAHVLSAFVSFWAVQSDLGYGEQVRQLIYPYVAKIIEASNHQPFDISRLFWVIEKYQYTEYIPLLKNHLASILQNPELHFWKIHDVIPLLLKFDPDFVYEVLKQNGKKMKDFKLKT